MKVSLSKTSTSIICRVSDFDKKYEDILKMCYYQTDGDSYFKEFSKNIKDIEKIANYFVDHAKKMFDQLGYFKPVPWEKALLEFLKKVEGKDIDWWLTGSCATCIRGIPLNPHDVDIIINSKDVNIISELFSDYLIEPIVDTKGWVTKDFGVIFLHARIDIASDPSSILDNPEPVDCGPFAKKHLEEVEWNGYTIKVPPLNLQINANKKRGRVERVKLIEEHLKAIKS